MSGFSIKMELSQKYQYIFNHLVERKSMSMVVFKKTAKKFSPFPTCCFAFQCCQQVLWGIKDLTNLLEAAISQGNHYKFPIIFYLLFCFCVTLLNLQGLNPNVGVANSTMCTYLNFKCVDVCTRLIESCRIFFLMFFFNLQFKRITCIS